MRVLPVKDRGAPTSRRRRLRPSVRLRLTLTYAIFFVVAGTGLLAVAYVLVYHREHRGRTAASVLCGGQVGIATLGAGGQPASSSISGAASGSGPGGPAAGALPSPATCRQIVQGGGAAVYRTGRSGASPLGTRVAVPPSQVVQDLKATVASSQAHTLQSLLIESGVALALMSVASLGIGWWVAGRVLRPVHRITDTARRLSDRTLQERINLDGPDDELKELADTFDAMLARLDRSFQSQRRFVANASHELRTPLATERVLIDEALANRGAGVDELRTILEQLRLNSQDTERLIYALMALARSERGVETRATLDLADVAAAVTTRASAEAIASAIELRTDLQPAPVTGDPGLIERLAGNLVENAIRHNMPGGWVMVTTRGGDAGDPELSELSELSELPGGSELSGRSEWPGGSELIVSNSGRVLDPETVPALLEPFRREGPDRSVSGEGFGLGLSIVDAIVAAHGGRLRVSAPPEGGLEVSARLPSRPASPSDDGPEHHAIAGRLDTLKM